MATLSHSESRRLYSWWWDSHISPKNSKRLQENLTDMDGKVKAMIKLIEEDADSFARRAEMYYKKRPELMKLVEEFYRAYRALAERYDHATGELRQAHHTMAKAFPNQVPFMLPDDSQTGSSTTTTTTTTTNKSKPHKPKTPPPPICALFDSAPSKKGLNELNKMFAPVANNAETEVETLKESLARLHAERESGLVRHQECLDRISTLEAEILHAQEDAAGFNERASKAEIEVQTLNQVLTVLEAEKEARALQYNQCLETISNLERKILQAEEDARRLKERADKAEKEVETLKQALTELNEEKEAAALQYQHCLETISKLEAEIFHAQEEAKRLNGEIEMGVVKLNSAEEQCFLLQRSNQSLQSEVEALVQKVGTQNQEILEKQQESRRLLIRMQEEHLYFMQAEAVIQTLQNLHSQSQEEQRALALKIQNRFQMLTDMELHNWSLEREIRQVKEENNRLNELNLSSALSIKNLHDGVFSLTETKGKLASSVKYLQDENSNLKEISQKDGDEKEVLREKLKILAKLLEKNTVLENSLPDADAELEGLRGTVKILEESLEAIRGEKSGLIAEKAALVSQLEIFTENVKKLKEKTSFLENSLSDANIELEGLTAKSKSLEESCKLLHDEKSGLVIERDTLLLQLETIWQRLEHLEKGYTELEERYSGLEKEKESTLRQVEQLRISLDVEKNERASLARLGEIRLACMENQVYHLHEEGQWRKKEFEEELDKAVDAQIEIFILQKCIQDIEEKNFSLLNECRKQFEASKSSDKLITRLEQENLEQQIEVKSLLDQIEKMETWIHQVLKAFEIDQIPMQDILRRIEDTKSCILKSLDEKQKLEIEKLILITLLEQLRLEVAGLETERNILGQDSKMMTDRLSMVEMEKQELQEMNRQLRLELAERAQLEALLKSESKNIHRKLLDLQGAYMVLQNESFQMLEENRTLAKKFKDLKEETCIVEKENVDIRHEVIALSNLSLVFKSFGTEKAVENLRLKESLEMEFFEAEKKLKSAESEIIQLQGNVQNLKREYDEATVIKEEREKQILKLSEDNTHKNKEIECLSEVNRKLESELDKLRKENAEIKTRSGRGCTELQERSKEAKLWETSVAAFYFDLQLSATVHENLFEEKVNVVTAAFESLQDENTSKSVKNERLKERVDVLEGENGRLKVQLAAYCPAIVSLRESIISLEQHALSKNKRRKHDNQEAELEIHMDDQSAMVPDGVLELQELQTRVKAVEIGVMEMERLVMQENLDAIVKLEAAMKRIEELKSKSIPFQENDVQICSDIVMHPEADELGNELNDHLEPQRTEPEISEVENGIFLKDIPLDQISECSSYGIRGKENGEADDQMLELWETAEKNHILNLSGNKGQNLTSAPTRDDFEHNSSELQVEKELSVDKLEIFKEVPHQEDNRKKILVRLASDSQKLTNLQITVQDLKNKVEVSEKSVKGKGIEYDTAKEQLQETEEAIVHLINVNEKLTKNIEEGKAAMVLEETGDVRMRRVLEQARQGSEKIGRLQLELQKIQFLLLKLEDEKESRGKTKVAERKTILQDYLCGVGRSRHRRKKVRFCACIRPQTKGY